MTRLSWKEFRDNEVRLELDALARNYATFLRCTELPEFTVTAPMVRAMLAAVRRLRAPLL